MSFATTQAPRAAGEIARWLQVPLRPGVRVVVAGVAGGVGTSTVSALLERSLEIHGRSEVPVLDAGVPADRQPYDQPDTVPVLVCAATRSGLALTAQVLGSLVPGEGPETRARAVVVPVALRGRAERPAVLLDRAREAGVPCAVVPLPRSAWLAAAGPGAADELWDASLGARVHRLGADVRGSALAMTVEVLRAARWVVSSGL